MKFSAPRETILKPLQTVVGVVERRQTMPILSNVLLSAQGTKLSVSATDLEVEMVAEAEVETEASGDITVPGRKLHDIFRALPDGTNVEISQNGDRVSVKKGEVFIGGVPLSEEYIKPENINTEDIPEIIVPRNHYYILSDNRKRQGAPDSRRLGPIPVNAVVGKVKR